MIFYFSFMFSLIIDIAQLSFFHIKVEELIYQMIFRIKTVSLMYLINSLYNKLKKTQNKENIHTKKRNKQ